MSNRKTIIESLRTMSAATFSELAGATGWDEYKVRNTVYDMRQAKLISSRIDDITGKSIYTLTAAGKQWKPSKKTCDTPAGGGDISPAPENRSTSLAACIPGEVSGVVEPPKPEALPAEARSDEKDRSIETLRNQLEIVINLQRDFFAWVGHEFGTDAPSGLHECVEIIGHRLADDANRIATLESNAELPLGTRTERTQYAVVFPDELHESPEAVMAQLMQDYDFNRVLADTVIFACHPVGKIRMQPMLVPLVDQ